MILVKSYGTLSEEYFFGTPCIIWLLFFFRIVFLDFLKYYSRFFCSFLPMRFSILEHKCEDLTSKNDIFGGSISWKHNSNPKQFVDGGDLSVVVTCVRMQPGTIKTLPSVIKRLSAYIKVQSWIWAHRCGFGWASSGLTSSTYRILNQIICFLSPACSLFAYFLASNAMNSLL